MHRTFSLIAATAGLGVAIGSTASAGIQVFDAATLGGTGDLGTTNVTINNVGGLSGVDLTATSTGTDGPANLAHTFIAGAPGTGENLNVFGVVGGHNNNPNVDTNNGNELTVAFSEEVLITQIVVTSVGRNDDLIEFTNLADAFGGTIQLSFDTAGTEGVTTIGTSGLDGASPVVDVSGLTLTGGGGFTNALVINFDTPVNTDGFVFKADQVDPPAGGVGISSITIVPEPTSLALLGLGGLLCARRRRCE